VSIFRYEAAGDQYVGRVVSGLSLLQAEFATLPPHFVQMDECVKRALVLCFPDLNRGNKKMRKMEKVAEMSLASLVYHSDFLRQTLPDKHILFESILFREYNLLIQLKERVVCRLATPDDVMQPTGMYAVIM
jgi:hypothetical protein